MDFGDIKFLKGLQEIDVVLCNPDRREISNLEVRNAQLTLRFNDLSELSFEAMSHATNSRGERIKHDFYPEIETKRLIFIDNIGYFVIKSVNEIEDGLDSYKEVECFSAQQVFQNFGFFMENRLYKFYDPLDEKDLKYDAKDIASIPSVVGQLTKQLQIEVDPNIKAGLAETPNKNYGAWTISYISPALYYTEGVEDNVCRSFTENKATYGYNFMLNEVGDKFQVVFDFDFLNYAIKIKLVDEVTEPTNIYLSFDNVVNQLQTKEVADDIVTVLSCVGNNLDIQAVNPTGTNYIADFSYYMYDENRDGEKKGAGWMSQELTQKVKNWQTDVKNAREDWEQKVSNLWQLNHDLLGLENQKLYVDKKIESLEAAQGQYARNYTDAEMTGDEQEVAEEIEVGKLSILNSSRFYSNSFDKDIIHTCFKGAPVFVADPIIEGQKYVTGTFSFDGRLSSEDTFENNYLAGTVGGEMEDGFLYFMDDADNKSFCKLKGKAIVTSTEEGEEEVTYTVSGFTRYTIYSYIKEWIDRYEPIQKDLKNEIDIKNAEIKTLKAEMEAMTDGTSGAPALNLQKRFNLSDSADRKLFFELKNYWIEGEYENQGFAVLDTTTLDEEIDLARQLLEAGEKELKKINQPRFSITVDAIDFTKVSEFREFSKELGLGKTIVIEKAEGVHYKPALTSISLNLDEPEDFELVFSNILRGGDWGFSFGELRAKAENTSRQVSANWQDLTSFKRRESSIEELLYNPLNRTLRIAQGNMSNQQFIVDETGILGRKYADESQSSFSPKQMRIINNVLMFTDDSWQTAKAALGEIAYKDYSQPHAPESTAYGLSTEVLVGSLLQANRAYIRNEGSTVILDTNGLTIENPDISPENEHPEHGRAVFRADTDGNVYLKGNIDALSGTIGGWKILGDRLVNTDETVGMSSSGTYSFWTGGEDKIDIIHYTASCSYDVAGYVWDDILMEIVVNTHTSLLEDKLFYVDIHSSSGLYATCPVIVKKGTTIGLEEITIPYVNIFVEFKDSNTNILEFTQTARRDVAFFVKPDGSMYATKGAIGGLTIAENSLSSDNSNFSISSDGYLQAKSGTIGGLNLDSSRMYSSNFSIGTHPNGTTLAFGETSNDGIITNPFFSVDIDGTTYIKNFSTNTFSASAAKIGKVNIKDSYLELNNTRITMGLSSSGSTRTAGITYDYSGGPSNYKVVFTLSSSITGGVTLGYKRWDSGVFGIGGKWVYSTVTFGTGVTSVEIPLVGSIDNYRYVDSDSQTLTVYVNDGTPYIQTNCSILPSSNATYNLGSDARRWNDIWCSTGNLKTSDIKFKNSIESLPFEYSSLIELLRPVRYKHNDGTSGRYHTGLIANELKEAIKKAGLTTEEVAAYCEFIDDNGEETGAIRYDEFIALLINEVQILKKEIKKIKSSKTKD